VSAAQAVKHAVAPQVYVPQAFCCAVGHAAPEPLQTALSVPVPLVHDGPLHVVVAHVASPAPRYSSMRNASFNLDRCSFGQPLIRLANEALSVSK